MRVQRAKAAVSPFLLVPVRIERATSDLEEWPDRDSFGNAGTVSVEKICASAISDEGRDTVGEAYLAAGFIELPRDSLREDDFARYRLDRLDPSNPFLWEQEVGVGVGGRALIGAQREILGKKVLALRTELSSASLKSRRRSKALHMLKELEAGLMTRISVEMKRRTFKTDPVLTEGASLGEVMPLTRLSQLVYTVVPRDPEDRDSESADPMYLTLLGVGESQVSFLFSGGIAGQRTITDLDNGGAHHAWFRNRKVVETDDTAPFIARSVFRSLVEKGKAKLVVRRGREEEPITLTAVGEEQLTLPVDGELREIPVLVAESEKRDRFWILRDPSCPLVLRMEETGAELLRTVDEVRNLSGV